MLREVVKICLCKLDFITIRRGSKADMVESITDDKIKSDI